MNKPKENHYIMQAILKKGWGDNQGFLKIFKIKDFLMNNKYLIDKMEKYDIENKIKNKTFSSKVFFTNYLIYETEEKLNFNTIENDFYNLIKDNNLDSNSNFNLDIIKKYFAMQLARNLNILLDCYRKYLNKKTNIKSQKEYDIFIRYYNFVVKKAYKKYQTLFNDKHFCARLIKNNGHVDFFISEVNVIQLDTINNIKLKDFYVCVYDKKKCLILFDGRDFQEISKSIIVNKSNILRASLFDSQVKGDFLSYSKIIKNLNKSLIQDFSYYIAQTWNYNVFNNSGDNIVLSHNVTPEEIENVLLNLEIKNSVVDVKNNILMLNGLRNIKKNINKSDNMKILNQP